MNSLISKYDTDLFLGIDINNSMQTEYKNPTQKTNSNYVNKKDSGLYEVNTNDNYTNERLNQIKFQQEKQNCSIRVTNLPPDIQPRDLLELFDLYGRIAERDGIKIKNYDHCIIGFDVQSNRLIYSISLFIETLKNKMEESEAIDYFYDNIYEKNTGANKPIFCEDFFYYDKF
jgi:RNA recognition motif-containing protein